VPWERIRAAETRQVRGTIEHVYTLDREALKAGQKALAELVRPRAARRR
jgi:hypothetical protein